MPTNAARLLPAALVAGALGLAGARGAAGIAAEAALARIVASHPGLHVGSLSLDPVAGRLELRDVATRVAGDDVSIRRLSLPVGAATTGLVGVAAADPMVAPAPAPPSGAQAPTEVPPVAPPTPNGGIIQADDVSITRGATTIRIKSIEMAGTSLSNADLAALLDPKAPGSVADRLRKVSAVAVIIPEIAVDDTTAGSERHGVIRRILLAKVVAGKAAAVSAAETSLALTDGQEAVNGSTGSFEAANVDLAQLAHVAETARTDAAEPILPLFDKAVINTVKLTNVTRNASLSAASLAATGVRARALAKGIAAAGATVSGATPMAGTPDPNTAALLRDLAQSFAIATLDGDDIASRSKASDGETSFTAAHIGLKAMDAGTVGAFEMRDFHLAGPAATLSIGTATVGAFDIPQAGQPDRTAARPGQVDLRTIAVDVTTRDKTAPGKATQVKFTVDHFAAQQTGGGAATAIPTSGSATIDNLGFDVLADSALTRSLYDMGYRHVSLSCVLTSTYDPAVQELSVHRLAVEDPALGAVDVALLLSNVTQGLVSPNAQIQQASAIAILAKTLDLKVINKGLFDNALALKAQQDGISVADERQADVDFFANKLPMILGDGANARTIGGAVAKFVADPKSLHIALRSKEGLGVAALGMLGDPGAVLDSLDVQATANE